MNGKEHILKFLDSLFLLHSPAFEDYTHETDLLCIYLADLRSVSKIPVYSAS